jgi:hypothetical protein
VRQIVEVWCHHLTWHVQPSLISPVSPLPFLCPSHLASHILQLLQQPSSFDSPFLHVQEFGSMHTFPLISSCPCTEACSLVRSFYNKCRLAIICLSLPLLHQHLDYDGFSGELVTARHKDCSKCGIGHR